MLALEEAAAQLGPKATRYVGFAATTLMSGKPPESALALLNAMAGTADAARQEEIESLGRVRDWLAARIARGAPVQQIAVELGWLKRLTKVCESAARETRTRHADNRPDRRAFRGPERGPRHPDPRHASTRHGSDVPPRPLAAGGLEPGNLVEVEVLSERTRKGGLTFRELTTKLVGVLHPQSKPLDDVTAGQRLRLLVASGGKNPQFKVPE
ncbi:MAG: hypothetical protein JW940_03705 [Polyangiaceae bacterium]|nr:hypothetical protein [Polyangiaceae bacterium]